MRRIWLPMALGLGILATRAGEWPQLQGPTRDGVYAGAEISYGWPKEGPAVVWKKECGEGFSGPVLSGERLFLFHRLADLEVVEALDARTGKPIWKCDYPTAYRDQIVGEDHGPRATPTIAGNRLYTIGAEGRVHCLDLATGKKIWSMDARADYGASEGFFGFASSPLVEGDAIMLNIGGASGAGILALSKEGGKLLWKATDDEASYSSPVMGVFGGQRLGVFFTRAGLVVLDPSTGAVKSRLAWRSRSHASVNAATPLVIGERIFLSASYGTGAILLNYQGGHFDKVWSGDEIMSNHYGTCVHRAGYLYGFDGRQESGPRLRCVELDTGKVRWTQEGLGAGNLILARDHLLILLENGQLLAAAAEPASYQESGRAQILGSHVRAEPALCDGFLYARGGGRLVCLDLRKK